MQGCLANSRIRQEGTAIISHPGIQKEIIHRIALWHKGTPQPPVRLHFLPTDNCNLHCAFCKGRFAHDTSHVKDVISRKRAFGLVNESIRLGMLVWSISGGGEPLASPYCFDLMKEIKSQGMYGEINTNGTLFSERVIPKLVDLGWDHIIVSLDGPDAKTNDSLRRPRGTFSRVKRALTAFSTYKQARNSELPILGLTVVLCKKNASQVVRMVELAHDLGCQNISFNPVKQPQMELHSPRVATLELDAGARACIKEQVPVALETAHKLGIHTNLKTINLESKPENIHKLLRRASSEGLLFPAPCYEPWYNLVVDARGNVGPCCESHPGLPPVNILQTSLEDAWFKGMAVVRERLTSNEIFEYCGSCGAWQIARSVELRRRL